MAVRGRTSSDATNIEVAQQEGLAQPKASPSIRHAAIVEQDGSTSSMTYSLTREEDVHFRICEEISRSRQGLLSPSPQSQNTHRCEVMELHEGVNPMTILGQALGQQHPNRFVRFMVEEDVSKPDLGHSFPGLDTADVAYLEAKAGLSFPPQPVCDELLRLHFVRVYPYAPILDRVWLGGGWGDTGGATGCARPGVTASEAFHGGVQ
ncbi:uncharacterized protein Z519_11310 [Cladophialophora bantiana CBS 173.52]|uniref:Uncharacterized protein n=1 Tax=Cladophialophora bantiana (strain ATCC 10958 / CBS 173.52 / CDC B-1940 / NIH 8579) TaxID=1442370 RepID=A0A0D2HUH6_CLAB1|nr:uncharacterized protein Z519_11310 [Cladophialophora bantiana CBS 173.52]KIW88199.1 hypothetical protein Z519_11310 [Cladophialophora bantiana CBS 173.52]